MHVVKSFSEIELSNGFRHRPRECSSRVEERTSPSGAGVDSAWEQEKPEARKLLDAKRAAESPASGAPEENANILFPERN